MTAARVPRTLTKEEPPTRGGSSNLEDVLSPLRRALLNVYFPDDGAPNLSRFFLEHGRLPRVTDEVKPWKYRGFLLPYVIELHAHPLFGKDHVPDELRVVVPHELLERGVGDC